MKEMLWTAIAWLVSRKPIADWIIQRAQRTPYTHLPGYMNRLWVFNAYKKQDGHEITPIPFLPSIRVHHILRKDLDRDHHDHPWDARSIILRNGYTERRLLDRDRFVSSEGYAGTSTNRIILTVDYGKLYEVEYKRQRGDTSALRFGEFHTITEVPDEGVWTLFFTFKYKGTWGFLKDGKKIPWRDYMEMYPEKPWATDEVQQ